LCCGPAPGADRHYSTHAPGNAILYATVGRVSQQSVGNNGRDDSRVTAHVLGITFAAHMRISVILLVIMVLLAYIAKAGDVELEVEHGDGHIDHREESHCE
ncbi:hypothetical protein PBRA_001786, partial [Plasmodiophora brassicae]